MAVWSSEIVASSPSIVVSRPAIGIWLMLNVFLLSQARGAGNSPRQTGGARQCVALSARTPHQTRRGPQTPYLVDPHAGPVGARCRRRRSAPVNAARLPA